MVPFGSQIAWLAGQVQKLWGVGYEKYYGISITRDITRKVTMPNEHKSSLHWGNNSRKISMFPE